MRTIEIVMYIQNLLLKTKQCFNFELSENEKQVFREIHIYSEDYYEQIFFDMFQFIYLDKRPSENIRFILGRPGRISEKNEFILSHHNLFINDEVKKN